MSCSTCGTSAWYPKELLYPSCPTLDCEKYGVIILNTTIFWKPEFFTPFWSNASVKVLVDGGANQFVKWRETSMLKGLDPPNLVTGDMDSIDKTILENFKTYYGVEVVSTPCQNESDFTKSLRVVKNYCTKHDVQLQNVIAVVGSEGRLDHIMANVQTLFRSKNLVPGYNVFLLGCDSLSWILEPGKHKIHVPKELRSWCALIPIGQKCNSVTTTGLKWNLVGQPLMFGGVVSTSNTYSGEDYVTVNTSDVILWSMGLVNIPTNYVDDTSSFMTNPNIESLEVPEDS